MPYDWLANPARTSDRSAMASKTVREPLTGLGCALEFLGLG